MKKKMLHIIGAIGVTAALVGCGTSQQAPGADEVIPVAEKTEVETVQQTDSSESDEESKAVKEFKDELSRIDKMDFEKLAAEGLAKAKSYPDTTKELRKWIVRIYIYSDIEDSKISDKELLEKAKESLKMRQAWVEYVQTEYKIELKKEEVDAYIKKVASGSDDTKAIAKGLGLTVTDMNYVYDRDQYELQMYWQKALPALEKKYPPKKDETLQAYDTRLNQSFQKELTEWMQTKKEG